MDAFIGLGEAISELSAPSIIVFFALGLLNGLVFGALPGLSGSVGIALMIPLTFSLGTTESVVLFIAALAGQNFSGSIAAILINTPGTSTSAATTLDGYPLARQGKGGFAIGISAGASALGATIGLVLLVLLLPGVRTIILAISFPEFFLIAVLGLSVVAMASHGAMLKGLVAALVGLSLSFVGFSPISGELRYVFGVPALSAGVSVIAVIIGVFTFAEVIRLLVAGERVDRSGTNSTISYRQVLNGFRYVLTKPWLLIRSSLIGTAVGIVPAVGGTVAGFFAYFQAARTSKDSRFGQGDPRGVLAPEAANDAKDAGAALPSLAFGVPGTADWAIVLGALILHGVSPGPTLVREEPSLIWIVIIVMLMASWVSSAIGVLTAPWAAAITRVRIELLAPVVAVFALAGTYALQRQMMDIWIALALGILAYFMIKQSIPVVPLILGLILGDLTERSYQQSLSVFGGLDVFFRRPIALTLIALIALVIALELWGAWKRRNSVDRTGTGVSGELSALMLMFMLFGAGITYFATRFQAESSQQFPLIAGITLVALTGAYFVIGYVRPVNRILGGLIQDSDPLQAFQIEGVGDSDATAPMSPQSDHLGAGTVAQEEVARSSRILELEWICLLVGAGISVWLLGIALTLPAFMLVAMLTLSRITVKTTLLVVTATMLAVYLLFTVILAVPLEPGLLFE